MKLLNIIDEDIVNYKKISMFIAFPFCSMKCNIDAGSNICQNSSLKDYETINIDKDHLIERYLSNPLSKAIVLGGLEPFDSPFDLISFVHDLRNKHHCNDDVVIYTGYTENELEGRATYNYDSGSLPSVITDVFKQLKSYPNIIVKFGRFIYGDEPHFDEVLGINLISNNQYAKII